MKRNINTKFIRENNFYRIISSNLKVLELYITKNELKFILYVNFIAKDLTKLDQIIDEISYRIYADMITFIPDESFKLFVTYTITNKQFIIFFEYKNSNENQEVYTNLLYQNIFNMLFRTVRPTKDKFEIVIPKIDPKIEEIRYNISNYYDSLISFKKDNKEHFFAVVNSENRPKAIKLKDLVMFFKIINNFCTETSQKINKESINIKDDGLFDSYTYKFSNLEILAIPDSIAKDIKERVDTFIKNFYELKKRALQETF